MKRCMVEVLPETLKDLEKMRKLFEDYNAERGIPAGRLPNGVLVGSAVTYFLRHGPWSVPAPAGATTVVKTGIDRPAAGR